MPHAIDMTVGVTIPIDPITGLDVEDLFGQVEWYQARELIHPNDDAPRLREERKNMTRITSVGEQ